MTDIKTAQELYEISQTKAPEIVADILEGVREHVIQRCEDEANKGATYYSIYLKKGLFFRFMAKSGWFARGTNGATKKDAQKGTA